MRSTNALANTMNRMNIPYKRMEGEAAFYGPKIDIKLIDAIGRAWQLGTVQFDFNLPARFALEFVGEDGARHQPLMVHRALLGSVERFFGILIEHYAGAFPLWLAPVQVEISPSAKKFRTIRPTYFETLKTTVSECISTNVTKNCRRRFVTRNYRRSRTCWYSALKKPKPARSASAHRTKGDLGPRPIADLVADLQHEISSRTIQ